MFCCNYGVSRNISLPQPYDDHWSCMRDGYGKSFEMIYGETSKEVVNEYKFYTKWTCKEENVEVI